MPPEVLTFNWYYVAFFVLGLLGASAIGCAVARYKQVLNGTTMPVYGGGERRSVAQQHFNIGGALAIIYTFGFLFLSALLYFKDIPPANKDSLQIMFGIMSSIQLAVVGFFFGSSQSAEAQHKSMADKAARSASVLEDMAKEAAPAAAAAATAANAATAAAVNAATVAAAAVVPSAPVTPSSVTLNTPGAEVKTSDGNVTVEVKP
jgi:hypothetical protein